MEEKETIDHKKIVIKAKGPMDVVKEDGSTDSDYRMFLQQDSFQRVQALLQRVARN
jgi:hypothetical protein